MPHAVAFRRRPLAAAGQAAAGEAAGEAGVGRRQRARYNWVPGVSLTQCIAACLILFPSTLKI